MADGSLNHVQTERPRSGLSVDNIDRIDELCLKASGIAAVIRAASLSPEATPDDAIPGACWAIETFLQEIKDIANGEVSHG